jgi:alpha-methylacyl-CoA racemase
MSGPLDGFRIVELAGIGPGPFACMMLADMGADVVRIDRLDGRRDAWATGPKTDFLGRGRRSVAVDLKHPDGAAVVLELVAHADALVEGYRPGVAERLGIGPEACRARNERLVFGRMTGWGQDGPLAQRAGHDVNYIGLSGVLVAIGEQERAPVPPLNLLGDFGAGGILLAFGVACALLEASRSGQGQVIDAAILDGTILLSTMIQQMRAAGMWTDQRGSNLLDGGAPFYGVYETADGGYMAVGALEDQFYAEFARLLGLDDSLIEQRHDRGTWSTLRGEIAAAFLSRSRQEWCEAFDASDACVTPVLTMEEVPADSHVRHREGFVMVDGVRQPAPAPRFSRTPSAVRGGAPHPGEHTAQVLAEWGVPTKLAATWQDGAVVG